MDGLVDSGAFLNSMSRSDSNAIEMNSDNCIIKEYPQPLFKIECKCKCPAGTTNSHSRYTIQHRDLYVHEYLCHPLKDVLSHYRAEFHAKLSGSNRHNQRKLQLPTRRDDAGYDRRNETLQP